MSLVVLQGTLRRLKQTAAIEVVVALLAQIEGMARHFHTHPRWEHIAAMGPGNQSGNAHGVGRGHTGSQLPLGWVWGGTLQ